MNERECVGVLLASAVHDMRNVLAVIRESSGLVEDILKAGSTPPPKERLVQVLDEIQHQIGQSAHFIDGIDLIAQELRLPEGEQNSSCDLNAVTEAFCYMIARRAKTDHISFQPVQSPEPVRLERTVFEVFRILLGLFSLCAGAGGNMKLTLEAKRHNGLGGVLIRAGGEEENIRRLKELPDLDFLESNWFTRLLPWKTDSGEPRFWLALEAKNDAD